MRVLEDWTTAVFKPLIDGRPVMTPDKDSGGLLPFPWSRILVELVRGTGATPGGLSYLRCGHGFESPGGFATRWRHDFRESLPE